MTSKTNPSAILFVLLAFGFFLQSFTFVDLNLTLLNWQPYLQLQSYFTNLGYFQRPLNSLLLGVLFVLLCLLYAFLVRSAATLSKLTLVGILLFTFSYNAFSYDLFNYMFDARIVTKYAINPYQSLDSEHLQLNIFQFNQQDGRPTALDFPEDEWTRFMHWTHRPYPYGPTWLLVSLIPSYLGLQKFLLTFLLFKLLFLAAFLLSCYAISRIVNLVTNNKLLAAQATALYAFNPLILIDGLLSPHLDSVMIALALYALYFAIQASQKNLQKDWLLAYLILLFSGLIKFATVAYFLVLNQHFFRFYARKQLFFALVLLSLALTILQALSQSSYQPWYGLILVATLPLLTGYVKVKYLISVGIIVSLSMWIYVAFARTGIMLNALPIF